MYRIYGIVYGDKQTEYTPYINKFTTHRHRFENDPIIDIVQNYISDLHDNDWLGIFSWKFAQKSRISSSYLHALLSGVDAAVQVVNCSPYLGAHIHFMNWSEDGHPGIKDMVIRCLDHVGLQYNNDCHQVIYANQFVCRKYIYEHYVNTVLLPSLDLLEGELWPLVNRPAGYTAGLELQELNRLTGLSFYNYVPFVLERIFMQYVWNYKYTAIHARCI